MAWDVEYTDEFENWWNDLTIDEQDSVESCIPFLNRHGPSLGRPLVDTVRGSRHPHMKELRPPAATRRTAGRSGMMRTFPLRMHYMTII